MPPPDLSIVIINYNTHELVRDCLESLAGEAGSVRLRVIIVDNASARAGIRDVCDEWAGRFDELGSELRLIASEKNLGFTGGNNLGLDAAEGDAMLLLNNDTIVHPGALRASLDYLKAAGDSMGILGPRLLNADGSHQQSCRRFPSFRTALFNRDSFLTRTFPQNPWSRQYLMNDAADAEEPMPVDWVSGAALFITRRAWARIGPLDERFFMYAEDVDWCKRAHDAGFGVVYLPEAEITHLIGQSSRYLPFRTIWWRHRSMWTFYYKHYSRRVALFDWATLAGIAARCGLRLFTAAIARK